MNKDINEPTKVCGMTLVQSKAVQNETSKWIKNKYPHFWLFKVLMLSAALIGVVGWHLKLDPLMPLATLFPVFIYIVVMKKLIGEYNEQALDELKIKQC